MSTPAAQKAALRRELRERRRSLSAREQAAAAKSIASIVQQLPGWSEARHVALYLAADGEIDCAVVAAAARQDGKNLYLPVINTDNSLGFAAWDEDEPLLENRFGIPEPPVHAARCPLATLHIVLLPLVGWDNDGGRLGMGGGFYDKTLAGVHGPLLAGLAHDCQRTHKIPREAWDVALDFVVTPSSLQDCRESRQPGTLK